MPQPLWQPSRARLERACITAFRAWLARERGLAFADYESLWRWSVTDLDGFWSAVWQFFDIRASQPYARVLNESVDAALFPGVLGWSDLLSRSATIEPARIADLSRLATIGSTGSPLPVKKLLLGHPVEKVAHADAMANPASLAAFVAFARRRGAGA